MIIGIDLHGVADTYPEIKGLLEAMRAGGNQIYIISGPHVEKIVERLEALEFKPKVHYDEILSVVHFLKYYHYKMWQDDKGNWWASDEDWWQSKARICQEYNVDIMIDDSVRYQEWFKSLNVSTKFILFKKEYQDRILHQIKGVTVNFDRVAGRPVIKGTRVTVAQLLAELSANSRPSEFAEEYDIPVEEVIAALEDLTDYFDRRWKDVP